MLNKLNWPRKKKSGLKSTTKWLSSPPRFLRMEKSVHLKLKNMQPVMQMHVQCDLESTDGDVIITDIWNTVHELGTN